MIKDIEPFPEWENKIDNNRTAVHITAKKGFNKKMKIVLQDINKRYQHSKNETFKKYRKYDSEAIYNKVLNKYSTHGFKKSIKNMNNLFELKRKLHDAAHESKFSIDFEDKDGLSPLHYAC